MIQGLILRNGKAGDVGAIPILETAAFHNFITHSVNNGYRVSAFFAADDKKLYAVLANRSNGELHVACSEPCVKFPSMTPDTPQVHLFEREIYEQHGIFPTGHPWLKPVRFHEPFGGGDRPLPAVTNHFRIEGDEIHEVAVGPVHAGVIEPGHFRFQCHGEKVFHLEITLGFQHRGIETTMTGGPDKTTMQRMETVAGDTTIGHATAYCMNMESLCGHKVSPRANAIRAIALEFERLANHVGDLGMLAQDVGYLPTASFMGRLRGDMLNLSQTVCGNRFGRGLIRPGGVLFDIDGSMASDLVSRLNTARNEIETAAGLLWDKPSVLARFENTGALKPQDAVELGLVGPAARACGAAIDIRANHPFGAYKNYKLTPSTWKTGDVYARAYVRWLEITASISFLIDTLNNLPGGEIMTSIAEPNGNKIVISLVEGWRGEVCHVAITNMDGRFSRYKIVDPSFHNWTGLAMALRGQEISDFPLCNKSFNLSYCGFDL